MSVSSSEVITLTNKKNPGDLSGFFARQNRLAREHNGQPVLTPSAPAAQLDTSVRPVGHNMR